MSKSARHQICDLVRGISKVPDAMGTDTAEILNFGLKKKIQEKLPNSIYTCVGHLEMVLMDIIK